ncbi:hypothetical protein [Marinobacter similis]|uniref:hypothetical protein n=1 Tax=Marinobacter similis TaxID=1420916 RepID=UPI000698F613|nr:hypothetical protein [Marinobacter similis]
MSRFHKRFSAISGSLLLVAAGSIHADLDGSDSDDALDGALQTTPVFKPEYTEQGRFGSPFAEPTIVVDGETVTTDEKCVEDANGELECKPAAGTMPC